MVLITKVKIDAGEYEFEILEYIKNNSQGVSITEIAHEKKFSRNTVAKYVSLLENKKLILKKKIGPSKLLFSVEYNTLASPFVVSIYKSLLKGLKTLYPNSMAKMKEIGKIGANDINFLSQTNFLEEFNLPDIGVFSESYIELFKNLYTTFDVLQPDVKISVIESDSKKGNVTYRFTNSIFLDGTDNFIYHLYFVCGVAEERISKATNIPVKVNIEKIHVDKKKEFSYYDLSITTDKIITI